MQRNVIKKIITLSMVIFILLPNNISFAQSVAGQEMRTQVLYLADIIENDNNMNEPITRGEFARMVVKASTYKDGISDNAISSAFQDVDATYPYASFINAATKNGYISSYLGGFFKPLEFVTYKELTRACLALLGYTNEDFKGNQVNGRYQMFCSLRMNENIDKNLNEVVTKKDCVNGIYNTLKTNKKGGSTYGPSVFDKMKVNSDGELNASGLIKTKLEGPFVLKKGGEAFNLAIPFDLNGANIFINGTSANTEQVMRELNSNGYVIYYYNMTTKTIYVYKEGNTLESSTMVRKGYINHIYYSAGDTLTPTRVEIDLANYTLANSEVKFAFSYAGTLHVGDQIIFIYTKENSNLSDEEGDGGIVTDGAITFACLYDLRY